MRRMGNRTDAELVALARSGNKGAFGELVERHQWVAVHVALGMTADENISRELAQEAMLHAYLSLAHLRDDAKFGSWLYGIVLNVCRSYLRDQKRAVWSLDGEAGGLRFDAISFQDAGSDPHDAVEEHELHNLVFDAVNALSPENRDAAHLFYYEQKSLEEIAEDLGISVAAVKSRLHRTRKRLKERLLPVYSEMRREGMRPEREEKMIKMTIADVVLQKTADRCACVVVLLDEAGRRILPIWVGTAEGEAIALGLRNYPLPRPTTHVLMASLLEATGAKLEEVRVEALKGTTFYAVLKLRTGKRVREVDARPSDAIALAVRMGSPIYATDEVMGKGVEMPEEFREKTPLGKGIDAIVGEIEAKHHAMETEMQKLLAFVFGDKITFAPGGES